MKERAPDVGRKRGNDSFTSQKERGIRGFRCIFPRKGEITYIREKKNVESMIEEGEKGISPEGKKRRRPSFLCDKKDRSSKAGGGGAVHREKGS